MEQEEYFKCKREEGSCIIRNFRVCTLHLGRLNQESCVRSIGNIVYIVGSRMYTEFWSEILRRCGLRPRHG
jgi:hypothetical protein